MIGVERDDGQAPPALADEYGFAVTFACEGGKHGLRGLRGYVLFCPHPVKYAHLIPDFGPGVWGFICGQHAASCRRQHPEHLLPIPPSGGPPAR